MHANEPIEPRLMNAPNQEIADAAWRAEVASRVCSYRARRTRRYAGENAPALDFGPAAQAQTFGTQSQVSQNTASASIASATQAASGRVATPGAGAQNPAQPAYNAIRNAICNPARNAVRNAIDTNYYRRLNAESMAQGSSIGFGEAVAATAPAREREAEDEDAVLARLADRDAADQDAVPDDPGRDDSRLDLEIRPTVAADSSLDRDCISGPVPEPPVPVPPVPGNLIVFPRSLLEPPLLPQPSRDELAEPMNRRPRILEVPEDIMPVVQGSLFPEIRLDGDEDEDASSREPEIEVPLRVAPVSARLMAGMTDWGVAMAAGLLFAAMAWRALPGIPHAKPFWMMLGAVTLLLWAIYQHLFLLYAGRTPGMSMRGIRLSTFDGQAPQWKQRRRRARFILISFAAVTLGFLWALVDEDALCWHDRISRTFPTVE